MPTEWAEQELAKHGRLETREIWVSTEPLHTVTLPRAEYIFAIRQTVRLYRCAKPGRREVVGITSHAAATADADRLLSLNRLHWTIENRVHRVLDEPTRPSQKRLSNFRSGGSGAAPAARSFGGFGGGSRIEAIVQRDWGGEGRLRAKKGASAVFRFAVAGRGEASGVRRSAPHRGHPGFSRRSGGWLGEGI